MASKNGKNSIAHIETKVVAPPVKSKEPPRDKEKDALALGATKIEKTIIESIRTAKLGLPDWQAVAKNEHISIDYLMNRVDWMRRMGMIR